MAIRRLRRDEDEPKASIVAPNAVRKGSLSATQMHSAHTGEEGPQHKGIRLGDLLERHGLVTAEQVATAVALQKETGQRLGHQLVALGYLNERALATVLAEQLNLEVVDLRHIELNPEVVATLPEKIARELHAIPIRRNGARIEVAVADPLAMNIQHKLIEVLQFPVRLVVADVTDIELSINKAYNSTAKVGDAIRVFQARAEARKRDVEIHPAGVDVVDESAPVVQVVNLILEQAVRDRASDVHIEPQQDRLRVRVRTDGALHEVLNLPSSMTQSLLSRVKVMADMNIVERRRPQDGQFQVIVQGRELDVRVSTAGTVFGEKCVLRLLDKARALYFLGELGMRPEAAKLYRDMIRSPHGMVVCAGPTGSGKTTTLYATVAEIISDSTNITTIEDPVEYVYPGITQIQTNAAAGITFATGLRSVLRQDPDVILVGEIRDIETARIATQAALTGHFVLTSLHATDSVSALHRFMDMGIEPFLIASSLLGVVGQRLLRRVCPHCVGPYMPTAEELSFFLSSGGSPTKTKFVAGAGCNFCGGTGYYERIGIYEVLYITDGMKQLIVSQAPKDEIRKLALTQGMDTLRAQGIELITQDQTTLAEVLRTVSLL